MVTDWKPFLVWSRKDHQLNGHAPTTSWTVTYRPPVEQSRTDNQLYGDCMGALRILGFADVLPRVLRPDGMQSQQQPLVSTIRVAQRPSHPQVVLEKTADACTQSLLIYLILLCIAICTRWCWATMVTSTQMKQADNGLTKALVVKWYPQMMATYKAGTMKHIWMCNQKTNKVNRNCCEAMKYSNKQK